VRPRSVSTRAHARPMTRPWPAVDARVGLNPSPAGWLQPFVALIPEPEASRLREHPAPRADCPHGPGLARLARRTAA
jgi:hypothetical protein